MREIGLPERARGRRGLRQGVVGGPVDLGGLRGLVPRPVDHRALPGRRPTRCGPRSSTMAGGPDAIVAAADERLDAGDAIGAVQLCEMALAATTRATAARSRRSSPRTSCCSSEHGTRELLARRLAQPPDRRRPLAARARTTMSGRRHRRRGRRARRSAETGLDDLGDPAWREGLDVLLDCGRRARPTLNDIGRMILRTWVHERLVNRLRVVDWVRTAPRGARRGGPRARSSSSGCCGPARRCSASCSRATRRTGRS